MSSLPEEEAESPRKKTDRTVAELFIRLPNPKHRRELEEFRVRYEKNYGPTDLTKRYTCTWPEAESTWLIANHPKLYWDGLPAFLQAFFKSRLETKHRIGKLDDVPDAFLELFLKGELLVNHQQGR